ncbi:MAG: hypothetical protein QXL85_08490 [Candidatus Bathyarchaeia archaeon]
MTEQSAREKVVGFSLKETVALIMLGWIIFVWAYLSRVGAGPKYWVVTGGWLPWIYILVVIALLGRKGLKVPEKTFIIMLIYILAICSGREFIFWGSSEVDVINTITNTFSASMAMMRFPAGARDYLVGLVPPWLVLQDESVANVYYDGGGIPAGVPYWEKTLPIIIAWSLILISTWLLVHTSITLFGGPQWYDVERLGYPFAVPLSYSINEVYPAEDQPLWGRLLDFSRNKIFWISFIVGVLLNIPYFISQVFPAIPLGALVGYGFGNVPINTTTAPALINAIQSVLPGAQVSCILCLWSLPLLVLMPIDFLATGVLCIFLITWIYPAIAIRSGWVPEGVWTGTARPFPWFLWAGNGFPIGLGILSLWLARKQIVRALRALFGGEDFEIHGISARTGMAIMIIAAIIFLGVWVAAGIAIIPGIIFFILVGLKCFGGARGMAELGSWDHAHYQTYQFVWPLGVSLGIWGATPPQANPQLAVFGLSVGTLGTWTGLGMGNSGLNYAIYSEYYGVLRKTRAEVKKAFYELMIVMIFLVPFMLVFDAWFNSLVGISKTSQTGMDLNWFNPVQAAMDTGVTRLTWGISPLLTMEEQAMWGFLGMLTVWVIYYLRSVFPWFFLNPVAIWLFTMGATNVWNWIEAPLALAIRYILVKVFGPRKAEITIIPFAAGLAVGIGALYLIVGAYIFFTVSVPTLATLLR